MGAPPLPVTIAVPDLTALDHLAESLVSHLSPGTTLLLSGPLGAGKTALARAMLRALCHDPALEVPSPSYTLVQTYPTPLGPVHHYDLWRIASWRDVVELGWNEARADITLVEWPDRLGPLTPARPIRLQIVPAADGSTRNVTLYLPS